MKKSRNKLRNYVIFIESKNLNRKLKSALEDKKRLKIWLVKEPIKRLYQRYLNKKICGLIR